MGGDPDRAFDVTLRVGVRADGLLLKEAAVAWLSAGAGGDPAWAQQRAQLREQLGAPAFDDQPWRAISAVTSTAESALDFLLVEALRVGLERIAPAVHLQATELQRRHPDDPDGDTGRS